MKRLGYKDVLISVSELIKLSNNMLTERSITANCSRSNANYKASSWISEPDPTDGRRLLIRYSSIPKQTIEKYKLPDVATLIDRIKNENALNVADHQQQELDFKLFKMQAAVKQAVENEFTKYSAKYSNIFPGKKDQVILYAKTHAVLQCCLDLKISFTIPQLHETYLKTEGIKHTLSNVIKFGSKLKKFQAEGVNIVHKCKGAPREHLIKLSTWHIGKIEQYYAHPNKYTSKMIYNLVSADCETEGKQAVSLSTIEHYVAKPEVKNRLAVYRDKAYYSRVVQPYTRRLDPVYSADLYYADGSPLQIPCWNQQHTKVIRLNLFAVMDVKSKKIVGFDLSVSEDRYNWFAAFKMAFSTEMLLPFEMMYDNASATKTPEFIELKKELSLRGCNLNPTTKGEPKQKADIERWFETFQSGYQRMIDGFIGEGIRSKRDNGRIDAEHLSNTIKVNGHYTYTDMLKITATLIQLYNNAANDAGFIPNKVFAENNKKNATSINHADVAFMFWTNKLIKVTNSEIKITIRKQEYYYEVYNHEIGLKINGTQVKVFYDETDLSRVQVFSLADVLICECRQKVQFHKAKANQTESDVLEIIKQSKHNSSMQTVAKRISRGIAEKGVQDSESFIQMANPYTVAKDTLNEAETSVMLNYISENKGVDLSKDELTRKGVAPISPTKTKPTIQERHSKQNIMPATLEIVGKIVR